MSSVPQTVRAEGLTELTGELVLTCSGGTAPAAGQSVPLVNFQLFLNTAVTSRLLAAKSTVSEATLTIDDTTNHQGVVSGNSITWTGIPVLAPAAGKTRVYRFTNIRVNASSIGPSAKGAAPIISSLSVSGATSVAITNPTPTLAFVQSGLTFSARDADNSAELTTAPSLPECTSAKGIQVATVRFTERFGTSFKILSGGVGNTESGFHTATTGIAGMADFGTRLKAVFTHVPSGVTLYVARKDTSGMLSAQLTESESGAFKAVAATSGGPPDTVAVPIVDGSGSAVWEILGANPNAIENVDVAVYASHDANSTAGTVKIAGSYAPVSTVMVASRADVPIPRFADSAESSSLLEINPCPTPSFTATPTAGKAPLAVAFDASASKDPNGTITSYSWEFGDGVSATGTTAQHTYPSTGTYDTTLTVTDNAKAIARTSRTIIVRGANQVPAALFTARPLQGRASLVVHFDAGAATDPDGTIAKYVWNFGDGHSGAGRTATHRYTSPGTFTARLTVTDDGGATSTSGRGIVVKKPPVRDTTPPRLSVQTVATQHILKQDVLRGSVRCSERCTVTVTARAGTVATFSPTHATLAAGRRTSFVLTLNDAALARVGKALAKGERVIATITVRARDGSGNAASVARTVELVP